MHESNKRSCPHCGSLETSRSHRHSRVERYLLGIIGVLPYRCQNCDTRFYAFSRFGAGTSVTDKAA
jgi:DNA-directed RNA polymerase subunit RPC12/RpoP